MNTAWGPSKRWVWGSDGRYRLGYYSRPNRMHEAWSFSIAGSGAGGPWPWVAMWRAWRFYRSQHAA